jgi:biotin carboxylase
MDDEVGESLPLLAIVYGSLSLEQSLLRLSHAAQGACRILWVLPYDHRETRTALRMMKAQSEVDGDVLEVSNMAPPDAADVIRAAHPDGITCFTDETIAWTAEVAALLGLRFHSPEAAARLTDKFEQRTALSEHGLQSPHFWRAEEVADPAVLAEVVHEAGLPVVLKPRHGTAGKNIELLRSAQDLRDAAATVTPEEMMIEGFIPDPVSPRTGSGNAPYVSVEIASALGKNSVIGVTGRTPLAEPFRETGHVFPAEIDSATRTDVERTAIQAVQALGITVGVIHVEIKPADAGPMVIEVNGRPAGFMRHEFITRALGFDPLRLAMRLAVGETDMPNVVEWGSTIGFQFLVQPPATIHRITSVEGLDDVRAIPGIDRVASGAAPGSEFTWRAGSVGHVAEITGTAPDHETVRRIYARVLDTIVVSGE